MLASSHQWPDSSPSCLQVNSLQHCVAAAALTWGDARHLPDLPAPDVILASDILYSRDQIPLLFQTIAQLSAPATVTLLAYEHREPVVQTTFDAIQDAGLQAWQAGPVPDCTREMQQLNCRTTDDSCCALCRRGALLAGLQGHEMGPAEPWHKGGALVDAQMGRQLSNNCSSCVAEQASEPPRWCVQAAM